MAGANGAPDVILVMVGGVVTDPAHPVVSDKANGFKIALISVIPAMDANVGTPVLDDKVAIF
jgi:hypothetical protein